MTLETIKNLTTLPIAIIEIIRTILAFILRLYSFYVRYICKKIQFCSLTPKYSLFEGLEITVCVENKSSSPINVHAIDLIIDNKYRLSLKRYDEPFFLQPTITSTISTGRFAQASNESVFDTMHLSNSFLVFHTTKGQIISGKKNWWFNILTSDPIQLHFKSCNGVPLSKGIKYLLIYKTLENTTEQIFIHENGMMSKAIFGCNCLSHDQVKSIDSVTEVLKNHLNRYGLTEFAISQPWKRKN